MSGAIESIVRPWHYEAHRVMRNKVEACTYAMIRQRRINASPNWLSHLPMVTKKVESHLYLQANSFEAYHDPLTLVRRLAALLALRAPNPNPNPNPNLP